MYLLYFGDIPNLVSCAFSTIPILFPPFNSQNFLIYLYNYNFARLLIVTAEAKIPMKVDGPGQPSRSAAKRVREAGEFVRRKEHCSIDLQKAGYCHTCLNHTCLNLMHNS